MKNKSLEILQSNLDYLSRKGRIEDSRAKDLSVPGFLQLCDDLNISGQQILESNLEIIEEFDFSSIKMLVMDCDGVLTDGGMYFMESGDELKRFNAKDGLGIHKLHESGRITGIISAGVNKKAIEHRAKMLNIKRVYVGKEPKIDILKSWLDELNFSLDQIAYIGDDLSDLEVLESVGLSICPADAAWQVREKVKLVLSINGGQGCVRELIDSYFLKANSR